MQEEPAESLNVAVVCIALCACLLSSRGCQVGRQRLLSGVHSLCCVWVVCLCCWLAVIEGYCPHTHNEGFRRRAKVGETVAVGGVRRQSESRVCRWEAEEAPIHPMHTLNTTTTTTNTTPFTKNKNTADHHSSFQSCSHHHRFPAAPRCLEVLPLILGC